LREHKSSIAKTSDFGREAQKGRFLHQIPQFLNVVSNVLDVLEQIKQNISTIWSPCWSTIWSPVQGPAIILCNSILKQNQKQTSKP
jgi:hypothetical protein